MANGLNFIYQNWHAWTGNASILLSDEDTKTLRSFPSVDDAITWLYLEGHKGAARALNATKSGGRK